MACVAIQYNTMQYYEIPYRHQTLSCLMRPSVLCFWRNACNLLLSAHFSSVLQTRSSDWLNITSLIQSGLQVNANNTRLWANMAYLLYENGDVKAAGTFLNICMHGCMHNTSQYYFVFKLLFNLGS